MASPAGLGKLHKRSLVAIATRLSAAGIGYLTFLVLANMMQVAEYGKFAFGFSLAIFIAIIGGVGQPIFVLRDLARYKATGNAHHIPPLLQYSSRLTLYSVLSILLVAFSLLLLQVVAGVEDPRPLVPSLVLAAVIVVAEFQTHVLRGIGYLFLAYIAKEILWRPVALAALLLAASLGVHASARTVLDIMTLTLVALTLVQFAVITRPSLPTANRTQTSDPAPEAEQQRWRTATKGLWLTTSVGQSLQHLVVVVFGLVLQLHETGALFAIIKTAALLALPLQALNLIVAPRISAVHANKDTAALARVTRYSALVAGAFSLVGLVAVLLFGRQILGMFNEQFVPALPALYIVAVSIAYSAMCGSSAYLMTMTGNELAYLRIVVFCNVIGIALIAMLAKTTGVVGAALGYALIVIGTNTASVVWARRQLGVDPSLFGVLRPVDARP